MVGAKCVRMTTSSDTGKAQVQLNPCMWGKERWLARPYPAVCHLLDTAAVCLELWDVLLGARMRERIARALGLGLEDSRAVVAFWAGLHDLGKVTPSFQSQVPEAFEPVRNDPRYRFDATAPFLPHEQATHWALTRLFEEVGYPRNQLLLRRAVSHQVAQLLGGHHGRYGKVLLPKELASPSAYQPGLGEDGWDEERRLHFAEVRRVVGAHAVPRGGLPAELAVVVTGLVVVADWLASQTEAIEPRLPPAGWRGTPAELDAHWRGARTVAGELVGAARLGRAAFPVGSFRDMFPFSPNALQRDVVEMLPRLVAARGPGLLLVTAPTGDGKTETALFAASVLGRAADARGLYFALPTMATADAMFSRVRGFADKALTGERALTLLHSMAWLSPVYREDGHAFPAGDGEVSTERETATEAGAWLRGGKRGLLAPLGVGTIDQALSAVLPLRYNALRLFALSDKVFVVDEAHAYGPWMHTLLTRLLEWLGALGAPVVLLSATLTGRAAGSLVNAYRRGAGFLEPSVVAPRYPGWLFTDAATGQVAPPREVASGRPRTLRVELHQVVWDVDDGPGTALRPRGRRQALREVLRPVVEEGGTALVCCTTVAESQRTFRDLREAFPKLAAREGGLRLLHSRYPAERRHEVATECEKAYGKPRKEEEPRPRPASVLVATQVVEQSLDLDFDLVVSDLAPLAQLLQRAGRGCRHARGERGRPRWALPENQPRLAVLEPVNGRMETEVPRGWGTVYDPGLLCRTARLLHRQKGEGIDVPGDVQRLVDEVYAEDFVDAVTEAADRELRRMDAQRRAEEAAEESLAGMVGICAPVDVAGDLHRLSRCEDGVTEELLTTRLGADTGRVLCLYEQEEGVLTLDQAGTTPLPKPSDAVREKLERVLPHVAPVPGAWVREGEPLPADWGAQPLLRHLVLLRMRPTGPTTWECRHGNRTIRMSEVGLEAD